MLDYTSPLVGEFGKRIALQPMFDVQIVRRVWDVMEDGSRLEVVVDAGEVVSDERHAVIREVEIELKDGTPADLFALARKIDNVASVRVGVRSKAERGFALLEAQKLVFKAEPLYLERSMDAASAFQAIALSCFRQFRLNEDVCFVAAIPKRFTRPE